MIFYESNILKRILNLIYFKDDLKFFGISRALCVTAIDLDKNFFSFLTDDKLQKIIFSE